MGYLALDALRANLFFQVVSKLYEKGSIVLTTNRRFETWADIFVGDSVIAFYKLDMESIGMDQQIGPLKLWKEQLPVQIAVVGIGGGLALMSLKCSIGIHKWARCKCSVCGKIQDKDHDWSQNWEECSVCGLERLTIREFYDAIRSGSRDSVKVLLKDSPNLVNSEEPNTKNSALHVAATSSASICDYLLNCGAKINAQNAEGDTPLHLALGSKIETVCDVLRSRLADLDRPNIRGITCREIKKARLKDNPNAAKIMNLEVELDAAIEQEYKALDYAYRVGALSPALLIEQSNECRESPGTLSTFNVYAARMGLGDLVEKNQLEIEHCQLTAGTSRDGKNS